MDYYSFTDPEWMEGWVGLCMTSNRIQFRIAMYGLPLSALNTSLNYLFNPQADHQDMVLEALGVILINTQTG